MAENNNNNMRSLRPRTKSNMHDQMEADLGLMDILASDDSNGESNYDGGDDTDDAMSLEDGHTDDAMSLGNGQVGNGHTVDEAPPYNNTISSATMENVQANRGNEHTAPAADPEPETDTDFDSDSGNSTFSKAAPKKVRKANILRLRGQQNPTASNTKYKNPVYKFLPGWDESLPPVSTIHGLFQILVKKFISHPNFLPMLQHLKKQPIRLATMCSGTECPVIAMGYISDLLAQLNYEQNFDHAFSAEIEAFKQAYIRRNFDGVPLFRDINEMAFAAQQSKLILQKATTAYGSKISIPGQIDILVTGFCCVDFSKLNKACKTIAERGESGDTFYAILNYARVTFPKFILFENVLHAPWSDLKVKGKGKGNARGINIMMKRIGYATKYLTLDTKDFGLPQTRQRGYMLCALIAQFGYPGEIGSADESNHDDDPPTPAALEAQRQLDKWAALVQTFKMRASVSAETMILAEHDDTLSTLDRTGVLEEDEKAVSWEKCRAEHHRFREDLRLGSRKTLTHWQENGFKKYLDFWNFQKGATSRVLDTQEIKHLQGAKGGFDDRLYSNMYDLSQNVYRSVKAASMGNVGCLTPRGAMFITIWGRKLLGRESWTLHGIPTYRMDLSFLSNTQLQDLAGNAMSSTVVGACLQALQLIFYRQFQQGDGTYQRHKKIILPGTFVPSEETSQVRSYVGIPARHLSVNDALLYASVTAKLCTCETRDQTLNKNFKVCTICSHTACQDHYGNLKHTYQNLSITRGIPADFEKLLKSALPKKVSFQTFGVSFEGLLKDLALENEDKIDQKLWYEKYYLNALQSDLQWKLIKRSDIWEVIYESTTAKLVLEISARKVQWLLFAKVESHLAGNDPRRKYLEEFPFARMSPTDNIFGPGTWNFRLPKLHNILARIMWKGDLVPSWRSSLGLLDYADTYVLNKCSVEIPNISQDLFSINVSGEYHLKQSCGQAMNSLHVKKTGNSEPLFMFLEHEKKTGDWDKHPYLFTENARALEYGVSRPNIARLDSAIGQPEFTKIVTATGAKYQLTRLHRAEKVRHQGFDYESLLDTPLEFVRNDVNIIVDGTWVECVNLGFHQHDQTMITYDRLPSPSNLNLSVRNCQTSRAVLSCRIVIPSDIAKLFVQGEWVLVDQKIARSFYDHYISYFLDGLVIPGYTEGSSTWHPIQGNSTHNCLSCSPPPPKIVWAIGPNNKQCPYENPEEASQYEHLLKNRPAPIAPVFRIEQTSSTDHLLTFNIGINPESLGHVAHGLLTSHSSGSSLGIQTSWRLVTDYGTTSRPNLPGFEIPSTRDMIPAGQNLKFDLRPEQLKSVQWQIEQEEDPPNFIEEEIVEAGIHQLNYRLLAKATQAVKKRGGLIASQTGFGKTPTTISLVKHRKSEDQQYGQTVSTKKIYSGATLVVVPTQLVDQWVSEINLFSITPQDVIKIKTINDLRKLTIAQVRDADWIIINMQVLLSPGYVFDVAQFAGMMEPEKNAASRAKDTWHETATQNIAKNLNQLLTNPSAIKSYLQQQLYDYSASVEQNEVPIPSKRVTGARYIPYSQRVGLLPEPSQTTETGSLKRKAWSPPNIKNKYKLNGNDPSSLKNIVFDMFAFARVVLDEAHYLTRDHVRVISSIQHHALWLLTATPGLENFHSVKLIAKILGIYLGKNDYASMADDVFKAEIADMTTSEKIGAFESPPSPMWLQHRHELAQRFLNLFARRDDANKKDIKSLEQIVLVRQPAGERSAYLELEQVLAPNNFETLSKSKQGGHYNAQLENAHLKYKFGPEALLYRASNFNITQHNRFSQTEYPSALSIQTLDRKDDIQVVEIQLKYHLKRCEWLSTLPDCQGVLQYSDFKSRIMRNHLGDEKVTAWMKKVMTDAEKNVRESDYKQFFHEPGVEPPQDSKKTRFPHGFGMDKGQFVHLPVRYLRDSVAKLVFYSETLTRFARVHRFAHNVQGCHLLSSGKLPNLICQKCHARMTAAGDVTILSGCGHRLCNQCLTNTLDGSCPVTDCKCAAVDYEQISGSEFEISQRPLNPNVPRHYGSKIDAVIKILQPIQQRNEQALVFVQDLRSISNLKNAMEDVGIKHEYLDNGAKASEVLTEFQSGGNDVTVLILNIGDSSAAGANLTRANHILFFSPYWTRQSTGQAKYVAAMEQAMGRAIRWGQKKTVYVHHFLTAFTYDVDYFEYRNDKIVVTPSSEDIRCAIAIDRQPDDPEKTPFSSHTSALLAFD